MTSKKAMSSRFPVISAERSPGWSGSIWAAQPRVSSCALPESTPPKVADINFPFPGSRERKAIWEIVFLSETPKNSLDYDHLTRLNLTGGSIHNIALNAAFLAADEDAPVRMQHLLRGARIEYAKLEKLLTDGEVRACV